MLPICWTHWAPRVAALLLSLVLALPLRAQEAPATLALEEAIALALRSNPGFRAQANDGAEADWRVREAYGALLPGASAGVGAQYQAKGRPRFGLFTGDDLGIGETPPFYFSDYSIGFDYQIGPGTLFRLGEARASRRGTEARVEAAEFELRVRVTQQYLAALRARDDVELARRELASAGESLKLAAARVRAGAAAALDEKQAEVARGRAEVALVQAEHAAEAELLRLMELLGVELERGVRLTSTFEVFEPAWSAEELVRTAVGSHPLVRARRADEASSAASLRTARSAFLPSVSVSAGWSGYTREVGDAGYVLEQARGSARAQVESCDFWNRISAGLSQPLPDRPADCSAFALTPAMEAAALANNDVFPFAFSRQPLTARVQVSVPLFNGFTRRRQLETAHGAAEDARHLRRAEELRRRTEVVTGVRALQAANRTVALERQNARTAAEQLGLARERYRIGAGSYLELSQAEALEARANRDLLAAIYSFHGALAALEAAVGHRLRR